MNSPSIARIMQTGADRPTAKQIKAVFTMGRAELNDTHPAAARRTQECYNPPSMTDLRMTVINALLESYGVEAFETTRGYVEYCNRGDTYITTICHFEGRFIVSSWGDLWENRRLTERGE